MRLQTGAREAGNTSDPNTRQGSPTSIMAGNVRTTGVTATRPAFKQCAFINGSNVASQSEDSPFSFACRRPSLVLLLLPSLLSGISDPLLMLKINTDIKQAQSGEPQQPFSASPWHC
jgi:hypothetical protein